MREKKQKKQIFKQLMSIFALFLLFSFNNDTLSIEKNTYTSPISQNSTGKLITLNETVNYGGVVINLNLTYNNSYEIQTQAEFLLRVNLTQIIGPNDSVSIKYMQISYGWMEVFIPFGSIFLTVLSEYVIPFSSSFMQDSYDVEDATVAFKLGYSINQGANSEMQLYVSQTTDQFVNIEGNLVYEELDEPGFEIWILFFKLDSVLDIILFAIGLIVIITMIVKLNNKNKRKKTEKETTSTNENVLKNNQNERLIEE